MYGARHLSNLKETKNWCRELEILCRPATQQIRNELMGSTLFNPTSRHLQFLQVTAINEMERSLRFLSEHVGGLLFRWVSEFYFTRDENMIDETSKTNLTGIASKTATDPW